MRWRDWIRVAQKVVPVIAEVAGEATSMQDARKRLAQRAMRGDLDDALGITDSTLAIVKGYVDNG